MKPTSQPISTFLALTGMVLLLAFCGLVAPSPVAAAPLAQADEPCATCHWSEDSQWQHSPHGVNGVACEDCHGPYVPGHPDEGMMDLTSDASQCKACHSDTEAQWGQSLHAKSGINCTNCHVSHSQTTRLASEKLCVACHANSSTHAFGATTHSAAGVTCVECHLAEPTGSLAIHASHDFVAVSPQLCLDCHGKSLHEPATESVAQNTARAATASLTEQTQVLSRELKEAEDTNISLKTLAVVLLGGGLGVGVMFGLIFMLVIGKFTQRKETMQ